jgi:uncharacterized protein Yka (UPF0111/DUF47 family)
MSAASTIGLARLPKPVRDLLGEAAGAAGAAATALDELARDPTRRGAVARIVELEDDGDRVTHDLQHAIASARIAVPDRGALLRAIQAVDDILDAIEGAGRELPSAGDTLPREGLIAVTAILRDLVRTSMAAIARVEASPAARAPLHERAHELDEELRRELRALHGTVADHERDVLAALRAAGLLRQLRSIGHASARALIAVEGLAGAHA